MQRFFVIIALVLLSSMKLAAQTQPEQRPLSNVKQVEFTKKAETERTINAQPVSKAKAEAKSSKTITQVDGRVLRVGPTTTYLKNGLRTDEVLRFLGKPTAISERREGNLLLSTYTFPRSHGRVLIAEFENGVLVRSRIESAATVQKS